jgi:hypothetical protein
MIGFLAILLEALSRARHSDLDRIVSWGFAGLPHIARFEYLG